MTLEKAMLQIHKSDDLIGWNGGTQLIDGVAALADPRSRGSSHQVEPLCGAYRPIMNYVEVLNENPDTLKRLEQLGVRLAEVKAKVGGATGALAEEHVAIGKDLRGKLSGHIAEVACVQELLKTQGIKVLEIGAREYRRTSYERVNNSGRTVRGEIDVVYQVGNDNNEQRTVFGEIKLTAGTAVRKDHGTGDRGQLIGLQRFANRFNADAMLILWGDRDYMQHREQLSITRKLIAENTGSSPGLMMRDRSSDPLRVVMQPERPRKPELSRA